MAYKTGIFSSVGFTSSTTGTGAMTTAGGQQQQQQSSTLSSQFQLISDDESLEDHSGLEDFQGVTLEINSFSGCVTPEKIASPEHHATSNTNANTNPNPNANKDTDTKTSGDNTGEKTSRERVINLPFLPSSNMKNFNNPTISPTNQTQKSSQHQHHHNQSIFPGGGGTSIINGTSGSNSNAVTPTTSVPKISITPMTPPSGSITPDGEDFEDGNISLNSSGTESPSMFRHRHGRKYRHHQKNRGGDISNYWRPQSPMPVSNEYDARDFFAYRDSIIQNTIDEVQSLVDSSLDGILRGTFLFTEIDHWNNELERLVLLCSKSLIIVKYDFIAMKQEEYRRIHLCVIDKIIQGELKYPDRSLTPRLSGIAGGIVGVVKSCIIPKVQNVGNVMLYRSKKGDSKTCYNNDQDNSSPLVQGSTSNNPSSQPEHPNGVNEKDLEGKGEGPGSGGDETKDATKTTIMSALSLENFEPRGRNVQGIRILWNGDSPISFTQKWNPFNKSIPYVTFVSHPLLYVNKAGGGGNRCFDIDCFAREFIDILSDSGGDSSPVCRIEFKPLIIESYVGLTSLFHNANELGFYKVRGRVSF